ncbi:DNA-binding transcriptional regulator [Paenibacillus sp. PCH8]|uniref:helix-turn-helix transcriptional regulator n=1 Tax=Paenibacillus sp. PCH8 TaxID=2066524 RepID=UPI000CF86D15|nr:YafY family protein [Paenibacillus sp. PCH8]PQP85091.1 DNA-binding transcriptional regulator [Paenibacillus sp. PCH8]
MSKVDNMLAILWMLNSGRKITAKQLSEKLEINIRTVYRYIDALCASGVPIISDTGHHGGYTLLNQFIKSPLLLDVEEKTTLLHAAVFAKEAGYFLEESLNSATSKLMMHSNPEQESMLKQHFEGVEVIGSLGTPTIEPILKILEQSVLNESSVEMDYQTSHEEQFKHRIVDPYGMIYWNQNWYVIAFCHFRNEIRSFRVDRINHVNQTELTFNRPALFSASTFFKNSLLPEAENPQAFIPLVLTGKSSTLDGLCRHWYMRHHLQERTPERAMFLIDEEKMHKYVPSLLLPYGRSVQVLEPNRLKHTLVEVLHDLIDYYQV